MQFAINFQLKVNIICIGTVKWHFLCNKKKMLEWDLLWNRGSIRLLILWKLIHKNDMIFKVYTQPAEQHVEVRTLPSIIGRWCFTDGSCKEKESYSGQGWYNTVEGFVGLMGVRNVMTSFSPLPSEVEALIWAMECTRKLSQFQVTFAMNCSQLVKIVSEPEEWPAFESYLEDIKTLKEIFLNSKIIHIPRTENLRADSLACSVRKSPYFIVH